MIVITGASDGLGRELARLYKKSGKKVVNVSRRESEFADINFCYSLREGAEIQKVADKILHLDEEIEAIIHNAGVETIEPIGEITEDEIKRAMSTNLKPQILLTSILYDRIKKDKTDIVCVSSTVGTKGAKDRIVYGASKWAVRGFAKNLQEVLKGSANRVISFCPGGFKSDIVKKLTGKWLENPDEWMDPEYLAQFMKNILDLPKNMEVSEVIINRRNPR